MRLRNKALYACFTAFFILLVSAQARAGYPGVKAPFNIHVFKVYGEEMAGAAYAQDAGGSVGIDSTGLVVDLFRRVGVVLPRDVNRLYNSLKLADSAEVPLEFGDLVFFDLDYDDNVDYVGIYWDSGKMLGADPAEGTTGMRDMSSDFWINRLEGTRRVVESAHISIDLDYPFDLKALRDTANSFLGVPYQWEAKELDLMDASGLTYNIYRQVGIKIPQTVSGQYETSRFENVAADDIRFGDLVFFYSQTSKDKVSHVGMYWDSGLMIHTNSEPGRVVFEDITAGDWPERIAAVRRLSGLARPFALDAAGDAPSGARPPEDTYMDLVEQSVAAAPGAQEQPGEDSQSQDFDSWDESVDGELEKSSPGVVDASGEKIEEPSDINERAAQNDKKNEVAEAKHKDTETGESGDSGGQAEKKRKRSRPSIGRLRVVTSWRDDEKDDTAVKQEEQGGEDDAEEIEKTSPREAAAGSETGLKPAPEEVEVAIREERSFEVTDNPPTVEVPITAETELQVKEPETVEVSITAQNQFDVKEPETIEVAIKAETELQVKEPETVEVVIEAEEELAVRGDESPESGAHESTTEEKAPRQTPEQQILDTLAEIESEAGVNIEVEREAGAGEELAPEESFAESVVDMDTERTKARNGEDMPGSQPVGDEDDYLSDNIASATVTEIEIVRKTAGDEKDTTEEEKTQAADTMRQQAPVESESVSEDKAEAEEEKEESSETASPAGQQAQQAQEAQEPEAEQQQEGGWVSQIAQKAEEEQSPELERALELSMHDDEDEEKKERNAGGLIAPEEFREAAMKMVGVPYEWGGKSMEASDSSGVIYNIYRLVGVRIPGSSTNQHRSDKFGIVARDDLRPGDIIFFDMTGAGRPNHVAMYMGDGKMIFASESAGEVVISDFDTPFWRSHYLEAKRLIQK